MKRLIAITGLVATFGGGTYVAVAPALSSAAPAVVAASAMKPAHVYQG